MVETRLQKSKKLLEMATDSQARSSHVMKDTTIGFLERMSKKIENMEISLEEKLDDSEHRMMSLRRKMSTLILGVHNLNKESKRSKNQEIKVLQRS